MSIAIKSYLIKRSQVQDPQWDKFLINFTGGMVSASANGENWEVVFSDSYERQQFFSNLKLLSRKQNWFNEILDAIKSNDNQSVQFEAQKYIGKGDSSIIRPFGILSHFRYLRDKFLTSDLNASNLDKFKAIHDEVFLGELFDCSLAICYSRNFKWAQTLISIIGYGAKVPEFEISKDGELQRTTSTYALLPDQQDFSTYLNSFFSTHGNLYAVHFARISSGVVYVLKRPMELMPEVSSGLVGVTHFKPRSIFEYGRVNPLSVGNEQIEIQNDKYISGLIFHFNNFIDWVVHPSASTNFNADLFDSRFCLLRLISINLVFDSFSSASAAESMRSAMTHSMIGMDRISNLIVRLVYGTSNKTETRSKDLEALVFKDLISTRVLKEMIAIFGTRFESTNSNKSSIVKAAKENHSRLISDLNQFVPFDGDESSEEKLFRAIRNLNHGGFIKHADALGKVGFHGTGLGPALVSYFYFIMLTFLTSPDHFVEIFAKNRTKSFR